MFGLSKNEKQQKANNELNVLLVSLAAAVVEAAAKIRIAEATKPAPEEPKA